MKTATIVDRLQSWLAEQPEVQSVEATSDRLVVALLDTDDLVIELLPRIDSAG